MKNDEKHAKTVSDGKNYSHDSHSSHSSERLLPPRGDYQTLLSFQKAEVIYDITFRFAARPSPGTARFRLGALSFDSEKPLAAGSTWCEFRKVALPRGHGRLEAILSFGGAEAGANYVDVKRVE